MLSFANIPNTLTLFRLVCIPIIIGCIIFQNFFLNWLALILYILACLSDFFDGYIARKFSIESTFGKFLDPIADKILVISIIFILVAISKIEGLLIYPSLIIIVREVLVSGLREFFVQNKPDINVSKLSKIKTFLQMVTLGFLIIGNDFIYIENIFLVGEIGLWLSSILTIYTGYIYFKNSFKFFEK